MNIPKLEEEEEEGKGEIRWSNQTASKNALKSAKVLLGWVSGAKWEAPLTLAKDRNFPYASLHPPAYQITPSNKSTLIFKYN